MKASAALAIARLEWLQIRKEPRFLLPFLVTPVLLIAIQGVTLFTADENLFPLSRQILFAMALLVPSLAVPLSADSFAGEKERNTLELLLCLPVPPGALFLGKVLGLLPFPLCFGWLGQGVVTGLLALKSFPADGVPPGFGAELAQAFGLTPVFTLFLLSLATFISLRSETVRGAAQTSALVMVLLFLVLLPLSSWLSGRDWLYAVFILVLLLLSALLFRGAWTRFGPRPAKG